MAFHSNDLFCPFIKSTCRHDCAMAIRRELYPGKSLEAISYCAFAKMGDQFGAQPIGFQEEENHEKE